MCNECLFHHLKHEFKFTPAVVLSFDTLLYILYRPFEFIKADFYRFKAVVLKDVLPRYGGLARRALDPNHLTCLLVLDNVAPSSFHLTIGAGVARDSFHLVAVSIIMLQNLRVLELVVAEFALE